MKSKLLRKEGEKKEKAKNYKIYQINIRTCRDSPIHKIKKAKANQNKLIKSTKIRNRRYQTNFRQKEDPKE